MRKTTPKVNDTILWNKESDAYTKRAKVSFGEIYDREEDVKWVRALKKVLPERVNSILDLGSGYGAVTKLLAENFPHARVVGLDPGKASIKLSKKIKLKNLDFKLGYSHKFNGQFDLVILRVVFQWLPRKYLYETMARIYDCGARYIYVEDFLPFVPRTSVSAHNKDVRIFKQDYKKLFTALPIYKVIFEKIKDSEFGENYIRSEFLVKRLSLDEAYQDVRGVSEKDKRKV